MLPPAVVLLILTACSLATSASASRPHGSRTLQEFAAPGYNATGGSVNTTIGSASPACGSHDGTISGCNATASSYNATAAGQNVAALAHNATSTSHNASTAAAPLPPQHLFQHGRKCGLQHISTSDQAAARAVKPHTGIAEGGVSIVVQVHFHVLASGSQAAQGNIATSWITAQISTLNKAFSLAGVSFVLASVSRTVNSAWYNMQQGSSDEVTAKKALRIGGIKDLNVYTANTASQGLLGWSTLPWSASGDLPYDGIVILWSSLPGGPQVNYNLGNTLVHESGHWMGLLHTFQGGCVAPGDYVDDTNPEANPQTACTPTHSCSASLYDPITNFMDYSVDQCMTGFTFGQAARMVASWAQYRDPTLKLPPPSPPAAKPRSPPLPVKVVAKPATARPPPPIKAVTKPVTARPPPPTHPIVTSAKEVRRVPWPYTTAYLIWYGR